MSVLARALSTLALAGSLAAAGDPYDQGNGVGGAYLATSPARIGGKLVVDAGTTTPIHANAALVSLSDGIGPTDSPIGPVCIDVDSPVFGMLAVPLDAGGNWHFELDVPNDPLFVGVPPLYANAITVEVDGGPAYLSVSKTVRVQWELPDSWRIVGPMNTPRERHTATPLGTGPLDDETRVLVAGGTATGVPTSTITWYSGWPYQVATPLASSELYRPLTRTFTPGPSMAEARVWHRAVRLDDGRVLVVGGVGLSGPDLVALASCEIYDPATNAFAPAAPMGSPRMAHGLTLLQDGRVLATGGGSAHYAFGPMHDTAEVYDPATNTWTPTSTPMSITRVGHTQTLLPDGRVLVTGGHWGFVPFIGGTLRPAWTNKCDLYDPLLDVFVPALDMPSPGTAFHAATLLPTGSVLLSGGAFATFPDNSVRVWNGATWSFEEDLAERADLHAQAASDSGGVFVSGGRKHFPQPATTQMGHHDGTSYDPRAPIGTNAALPGQPARSMCNHTMTRLFDGTFLVAGGSLPSQVFDDALVYVP